MNFDSRENFKVNPRISDSDSDSVSSEESWLNPQRNFPLSGFGEVFSPSNSNVGWFPQQKLVDFEDIPIQRESNFSLPTPTMSSGVAGAVLNYGISKGIDLENSINSTKASMGLGPSGHSFDANVQAELQNQTNSEFGLAAETAVAVGSAFGPEGLAIGAGVAALSLGAGQVLSSDVSNTSMGTNGQMTNDIDQL